MNITGRITKILEIESGTSKAGKEWSKQGVVIDTGEKFNPLVCISFFGDKLDLLKKVCKEQKVEVGINISSREFNGKWYHSIGGWKINKVGEEKNNDESDDLPF